MGVDLKIGSRFLLASFLVCGVCFFSHSLIFLGTPGQAEAQAQSKKVALVIGNKDYLAAPLANSLNDARDVATRLKIMGFEVTLTENLPDEKEMKKIVRSVAQQIQPGGTFLFYYSGHGVQVNGINYLLPTRAEIHKEEDIEYEALNFNLLLDEIEAARASVNIVILDACRDNPFSRSTRSSTRGLAGITKSPSGTFIAYATSPGETASDNPNGRNGLFTQEFLKSLEQPGLKVEEVFKLTAREVRNKSGNNQQPWSNSSLVDDFVFLAARPGQIVSTASPHPLPTTSPSQTPVILETPRPIPPFPPIPTQTPVAFPSAINTPLSPPMSNSGEAVVSKGFLIVPPAGWTKGTPNNNAFMIYLDESKNNFRANFNVNVSTDDDTAINKIGSLIKPVFARQFSNWRSMDEGITSIGGQEAYYLSSRFNMQGYDIQNLQYYIRGKNRRFYVLTFTSLYSNFAQYEAIFKYAASSVRVLD